ncbi:MAG: DivIVA domain-containing protein [Cyclobacteriaceae bacterium]
MKITPLEIRQKTFEKKLRGFDKDEVNGFLLSMSNEWERILDENKELRIKLDQAEKEVQKLREVESSLFKTLKTAEDTGANLIDQATKAAELHMKETEMNSEALLSESKSKARAIIEKAESEARQLVDELQGAVKSLEQNYRAIENHRDNVIGELRNLSSDILDRIQRTNKARGEFKLDDHVKKVKELARSSQDKINTDYLASSQKIAEKQKEKFTALTKEKIFNDTPEPRETTAAKPQTAKRKESNSDNSGGSFFDELE